MQNQINYWASLCESEDTKSWLKDAINEPVSETIKRISGDMITEMALPLKEFRKRVDGLRFQLIENWCLCKYCQLYDPSNVNRRHWAVEFRACMQNIRDFEIKGKADKKKTIYGMFIDDYDYNQERKILEIIRDKFDVENINDMSKRNKIVTSFVNSIDKLMDTMSSTQISIAEYILTTFQYQITA